MSVTSVINTVAYKCKHYSSSKS